MSNNEQYKLSIHKDNSPEQNLQAIKEIIEYMEWGRIRKVMKMLDWKWGMSTGNTVPTKQQLKDRALGLALSVVGLSIASGEGRYTACGGVEARTHYFDDGSIALTISFVLDSWDNYL